MMLPTRIGVTSAPAKRISVGLAAASTTSATITVTSAVTALGHRVTDTSISRVASWPIAFIADREMPSRWPVRQERHRARPG